MSNKTSDKNVANIEDDVNELKRLLYSDILTQYGKRKLVNYYEQRIQELEEELKFYENVIQIHLNTIINYENIARNEYIPKQVVIDVINRHKLAYEEFNKKYNNTHYEDDEKRARDFYMIVTEDRIVQVLKKLLEGEK